jgi:hypothetical protein
MRRGYRWVSDPGNSQRAGKLLYCRTGKCKRGSVGFTEVEVIALGLDCGVSVHHTAMCSRGVCYRDLVVTGRRSEAFIFRRIRRRLIGSRWRWWRGSQRGIGLGQGNRSLARSHRFDGGDRCWSSDWGSCSGCGDPLRWVGATIWTVLLLDALGESLELRGFDMEQPLEVRAHLVLHLIYLLESVEVLSGGTPRLVVVGVVASDLRGDHEGRNEETVAAGSSSSGESLL